MKSVTELIKRLKEEKYKFIFDGEEMFEFLFGELKLVMYVECNDEGKPIIVAYRTVIDDHGSYNEDFYIEETFIDNYDEDKGYQDLNIEDVLSNLEQCIENIKEKNYIISKIQKYITEIGKLVDGDETNQQIVRSMIDKSLIFE